MFVAREERRPLGGLLGLLVPSTMIGALAGAGLFLFENPSFEVESGKLWSPPIVSLAVVIFATSLLLIGRAGRWGLSVLVALGISGLMMSPLIVGLAFSSQKMLLWWWPVLDWYTARPVPFLPLFLASFCGLIVLGKSLVDRPDSMGLLDYRTIFINFVTLPLLLLILVFAFVLLLIGVSSFYSILERINESWKAPLPIDEGWVAPAILGGLLGGLIGVMRMQRVALGVIRYALLSVMRYALPFIGVVSLVAVLVSWKENGGLPWEEWDYAWSPAWWVGLVLASFALVYQNGQQEKPPLWLRASAWVAILSLILPLYKLGYGLLLAPEKLLQVADFGGAWVSLLLIWIWASAMAGMLSEINWRARKWMAPVRHGFRLGWVMLAATPLWLIAAGFLGGG